MTNATHNKHRKGVCDWPISIFVLLSGATKEALKSGLSDMDYLRSKVAQTEDTMEESKEKQDGEEENDDEGEDDEDEDGVPAQHTDSAYESGDKENLSKTKTLVSSGDEKQSKIKKTAKQEVTVQIHTLNKAV